MLRTEEQRKLEKTALNQMYGNLIKNRWSLHIKLYLHTGYSLQVGSLSVKTWKKELTLKADELTH